MEKKHYLHVTGMALVDVTYNYEILDLEKFKQELKDKRPSMEDIQCLWSQGILSWKSEIVKYDKVDYDGVREDSCYTEVNGSNDEVEKILEEYKIRELDEWYN